MSTVRRILGLKKGGGQSAAAVAPAPEAPDAAAGGVLFDDTASYEDNLSKLKASTPTYELHEKDACLMDNLRAAQRLVQAERAQQRQGGVPGSVLAAVRPKYLVVKESGKLLMLGMRAAAMELAEPLPGMVGAFLQQHGEDPGHAVWVAEQEVKRCKDESMRLKRVCEHFRHGRALQLASSQDSFPAAAATIGAPGAAITQLPAVMQEANGVSVGEFLAPGLPGFPGAIYSVAAAGASAIEPARDLNRRYGLLALPPGRPESLMSPLVLSWRQQLRASYLHLESLAGLYQTLGAKPSDHVLCLLAVARRAKDHWLSGEDLGLQTSWLQGALTECLAKRAIRDAAQAGAAAGAAQQAAAATDAKADLAGTVAVDARRTAAAAGSKADAAHQVAAGAVSAAQAARDEAAAAERKASEAGGAAAAAQETADVASSVAYQARAEAAMGTKNAQQHSAQINLLAQHVSALEQHAATAQQQTAAVEQRMAAVEQRVAAQVEQAVTAAIKRKFEELSFAHTPARGEPENAPPSKKQLAGPTAAPSYGLFHCGPAVSPLHQHNGGAAMGGAGAFHVAPAQQQEQPAECYEMLGGQRVVSAVAPPAPAAAPFLQPAAQAGPTPAILQQGARAGAAGVAAAAAWQQHQPLPPFSPDSKAKAEALAAEVRAKLGLANDQG